MIPLIGLGTYRVTTDCYSSVQNAIKSGYRLIDSATVYRNEAIIGKVINEILKQNTLERKDLFICTKLAPKDHGFNETIQAVNQSLMLLNVEYLDIYFIHWPGKQKLKREDPLNKEFRKQSYLAIEKLYRDKKIKYIGVSNYTIRHLEEIKEFANLPHILQKPLLDYCNQNNIIFQAYSSFGEGVLLSGQHPSYQLLSNIGMKYNVKISQVLLRWAIQHGAHVIPKSTNIERQKENFDISHFELELEDMLLIDRLDQTESKRFCWDPTDVY